MVPSSSSFEAGAARKRVPRSLMERGVASTMCSSSILTPSLRLTVR